MTYSFITCMAYYLTINNDPLANSNNIAYMMYNLGDIYNYLQVLAVYNYLAYATHTYLASTI